MSMKRIIVVLGLLEIFGPISMDLYSPSLPALARSLGTSDSMGQATMSVCMLGLGLGQMVMGPLSDRFGRRRPLIIGIAGFALLSVVCATAPSIQVLLVARFFQGVCGSAGIVLSLAIARDLANGVELVRLLAMLTSIGSLAPIVAPVVGGQLTSVMSWRGIFGVLAGIGAALCVLAAVCLHESLPLEQRRSGGVRGTARTLGVVLRDGVFVRVLMVGAAGGAAFFVYLASITFVLQNGYHLSPRIFSACFALNAIASVLGAQANRALVHRFGPVRLYTIGVTMTASMAAVTLLSVLLGLGLAALIIALAVLMFFTGGTMANGSAIALMDHGRHAGTASAVLGTSSFVVGPVLAPLVSVGGATAHSMTLAMTVAYGTACVLVWAVVFPRVRAHQAAITTPG
ncbi:MAG: multidrug effflux MFS transporter [Acidimicrobiales bacterium]